MNKIKCILCGTNTPHSENHYYARGEHDNSISCYLLMFFKTPFMYKASGKTMTCDEYHYILFPPGTFAEHGSYKTGFVNDWIFFKGAPAENIINKFSLPSSTPFRINDHSIIEQYITKIESEFKFKYNCYEEQISALLAEMLVTLGRQYEYIKKDTHPAFEAINNARVYMLNHLAENISIKKLAEYSNYSASRFCVLYKEFFSVTPVEDLLNARIEKAASLIRYNHTSITETAGLCGFSSLHYFSRKFKEITGVPPSHYLNY